MNEKTVLPKVGETWRLVTVRRMEKGHKYEETFEGIVDRVDAGNVYFENGWTRELNDTSLRNINASRTWEKIKDAPRQEPPVGSIVACPGAGYPYIRLGHGWKSGSEGQFFNWSQIPNAAVVVREGWGDEPTGQS